jgi:hypothetical protein
MLIEHIGLLTRWPAKLWKSGHGSVMAVACLFTPNSCLPKSPGRAEWIKKCTSDTGCTDAAQCDPVIKLCIHSGDLLIITLTRINEMREAPCGNQ